MQLKCTHCNRIRFLSITRFRWKMATSIVCSWWLCGTTSARISWTNLIWYLCARRMWIVRGTFSHIVRPVYGRKWIELSIPLTIFNRFSSLCEQQHRSSHSTTFYFNSGAFCCCSRSCFLQSNKRWDDAWCSEKIIKVADLIHFESKIKIERKVMGTVSHARVAIKGGQ